MRENYPRKCFWTEEKETRVKFNPGFSANWPSNNWALNCKFSAPSIQSMVKVPYNCYYDVYHKKWSSLKICSQYAKRKINNTVRVCSSQISSVRHLPYPSLLRRPFRQSTNTPTHPLRWNCSLLRSRRKFKSHRKEAIGNFEICRAKKLLSHVDRFCS